MGEMRYRGRSLDDLKSLPDIYQTFTVAQVQQVAQQYFKDDRMIRLEVIPSEVAMQPSTTRMSATVP